MSLINLLPEDIVNKLLYWRDQFVKGFWEVGDLTNMAWAHIVANNHNINKMRLYDIVGEIVGREGRTIREYATMSEFYSLEARRKYDILPYSHFVFAQGYNRKVNWEKFLDTAMDMTARLGYVPAVIKVVRELEGKKEETIGEKGFYNPIERSAYSENMILLQQQYPQKSCENSQHYLLDELLEIARKIRLYATMNRKLAIVSTLLDEAIEELRSGSMTVETTVEEEETYKEVMVDMEV